VSAMTVVGRTVWKRHTEAKENWSFAILSSTTIYAPTWISDLSLEQ
jgi:hypothetical protein